MRLNLNNVSRNAFELGLTGVLFLVGCGQGKKDESHRTERLTESAPGPVGQYSSQGCFLNRLAKLPTGEPAYTRATYEFRVNQVGTAYYDLYLDSQCIDYLSSSQYSFRHVVDREVGEGDGSAQLLKIEPFASGLLPPAGESYWMSISKDVRGLYVDVDSSNGREVPYESSPDSAELTRFLSEPHKTGILFLAE